MYTTIPEAAPGRQEGGCASEWRVGGASRADPEGQRPLEHVRADRQTLHRPMQLTVRQTLGQSDEHIEGACGPM